MNAAMCTRCGSPLREGALVCGKCGESLVRSERLSCEGNERSHYRAGDMRRITLALVIAWTWAVLVGIPGIMMLFEDKAGAGAAFIVSALVALPPVNEYVARRWHLTYRDGCAFSNGYCADDHYGWVLLAWFPIVESRRQRSIVNPASYAKCAAGSLWYGKYETTEKFAAQSDWDLRYSYDCGSFGQQGNFQVFIYDDNGSLSFANSGVNELSMRSSNVDHLHTGGTFYMEVNSECQWHIQVIS